MASIKQRKSKFSVIYWYMDDTGERKQKWDTLETKKEAKAFLDACQGASFAIDDITTRPIKKSVY